MKPEILRKLQRMLVNAGVDRRYIPSEFDGDTEELRNELGRSAMDLAVWVVNSLADNGWIGNGAREIDGVYEQIRGIKIGQEMWLEDLMHITKESSATHLMWRYDYANAMWASHVLGRIAHDSTIRTAIAAENDDPIPSDALDWKVTGVYGNNDISSEWFYETESDVTWEVERVNAAEANGMDMDDPGFDEWMEEWSMAGDGSELRFYGGWKWNESTQQVDEDDDAEFSALTQDGGIYYQVVQSKSWAVGRWASPCYPGQADARATDNHFLPEDARIDNLCIYHALPEWALYKEE